MKRHTFRARVTVAGARVRIDVPVPRLVSVTGAARRLDVPKSNITQRLVKQGRLRPVPVEGSADVYLLEEVDALAAELAAERAERAQVPA